MSPNVPAPVMPSEELRKKQKMRYAACCSAPAKPGPPPLPAQAKVDAARQQALQRTVSPGVAGLQAINSEPKDMIRRRQQAPLLESTTEAGPPPRA